MNNYTPTSLPDEYREYFLSALYSSPEYKHLDAKFREDAKRAISKLHSHIKLQLLEDQFLLNLLKQFKDKETVDKLYWNDHITLKDLRSQLPDDKRENFDIVYHSAIFAIDLLDSCVRTINEHIHSLHPDHDFMVFNKITQLAKESKALLAGFHKDKTEKYEQAFADEADYIQDYLYKKRMPVFLRKLDRLDRSRTLK